MLKEPELFRVISCHYLSIHSLKCFFPLGFAGGGLEPNPALIGRRQDTPCVGRKSIVEHDVINLPESQIPYQSLRDIFKIVCEKASD